MSERIHTAARAGSGTRKWTLLIAGTAVALLAAAVVIQVSRPTSAYPEDGSKGSKKPAQAGRAAMTDSTQNKKVARVGNELITWEELASECIARHGAEILDNLINRKIIQQACDAQGVQISEAEVDAEIIKISKKFGLDPQEWMKMLQAERNVTPMQYRRDIIWPLLALRKLAGEEVTITKQDLERAFFRNYGPRVKAQAIVLDNQRRARQAWEKANENPEEFAAIAKEYSIDPGSRAMEARIPPIPRYGGQDALEEAAFKLKEGDISPVVQVGLNQWVILKSEGRTKPTVEKGKDGKIPSEIEELLREQLHEEKVQTMVAKVFEKIKEEARVDNYLSGKTTGGKKTAAGEPGAVRPAGGSAAGNGRAEAIETEFDEPPVRAPSKKSSAGRASSRGAAPGAAQ